MMRNCASRPEPGPPAVAPSCRRTRGQARRGTTVMPGQGRPRLAVMPASGRAGAVTGPPCPGPGLSTAPAPALPAICDASKE
jgi:hypothetical protein